MNARDGDAEEKEEKERKKYKWNRRKWSSDAQYFFVKQVTKKTKQHRNIMVGQLTVQSVFSHCIVITCMYNFLYTWCFSWMIPVSFSLISKLWFSTSSISSVLYSKCWLTWENQIKINLTFKSTSSCYVSQITKSQIIPAQTIVKIIE